MDTKIEKSAKDQNAFAFDLPAVNAPKAKPRIHFAGQSVCTACEG